MHLVGRARLRLEAATDWLPRWLAVLFPFSIAGTLLGQGYLVPPSGFQGAPAVPQPGIPPWSATQQAGGPMNGQINSQANNGQETGAVNGQSTGQIEGQPGATAGTPVGAPMESLMQWGALHLRARANYQFLYATGVHSAPGESSDTYTHALTPGLTIEIGPHVSLNYTPSFRFFSERNFHNTIDQAVSLSAGAAYGDWTFGVSQSYTRTDEPLVETSSQTATENYQTGLSASYQFNDKITFSTSGSLGFSVIDNSSTNVFVGGNTNAPAILSDSQNYSGSEWMDYQIDEKLNAGVGVTVGYSEQNGGFKSLDEQYQGRFTWHPGRKLSVFLSGGIEDRQFLDVNAPAIVTPIFSASIGYHLFEQTTLALTAARDVSASLFQSDVTESTSLGISLQQRLLGKLQLSLGFSYATSDYKTTTANLALARSDDTEVYTVGLSFPFLKRCSFSTFYDYSQNSSSDLGFGFSSSQAGAALSWAY
ncbi:MAG TPA: autotransporter outer membrane beta-barrel domain-containing protein [Verrucomicrobiae bacterium]|jgi:predicted porin